MKKSFVKVCFRGFAQVYDEYCGKEYEFGTYQKLEIGDFVVVDTQYGLHVAKVCQINTAGEHSNKLVVCKVDLKQHLETYKKVAESDPEMKKLIEEFEAFNKEEV